MLDNRKLSGGCQVVTDWSSDLTEASVYVQVIHVSQKIQALEYSKYSVFPNIGSWWHHWLRSVVNTFTLPTNGPGFDIQILKSQMVVIFKDTTIKKGEE